MAARLEKLTKTERVHEPGGKVFDVTFEETSRVEVGSESQANAIILSALQSFKLEIFQPGKVTDAVDEMFSARAVEALKAAGLLK